MNALRLLRPSLAALLITSLARGATTEPPITEVVRDSLQFAAAQYTQMLAQLKGKDGCPRTVEHGKLTLIKPTDWTSGFFPGGLWYLFEATNDSKWREAAKTYTAGLESAKNNTSTHDVGFVLYTSYGNGLRLT